MKILNRGNIEYVPIGLDIDKTILPVKGTVINIYGTPNSGKSYFLNSIIRTCSINGIPVIIFTSKIATIYTTLYDCNNVYMIVTKNIEETFDVINYLLNLDKEILIVIDDISLMHSIKETSMSNVNNALYMETFSKFTRLIKTRLLHTNSTLILVSEMRTQISKKKQVIQFAFLNDICDYTYEFRIFQKTRGYIIISISQNDFVNHRRNIKYITIPSSTQFDVFDDM